MVYSHTGTLLINQSKKWFQLLANNTDEFQMLTERSKIMLTEYGSTHIKFKIMLFRNAYMDGKTTKTRQWPHKRQKIGYL